jgi:hypothetical protein
VCYLLLHTNQVYPQTDYPQNQRMEGIKAQTLVFAVICAILGLNLILNPVEARVSKSFVRGFLVGYAKGLEEGKNLVHVQPVFIDQAHKHGSEGGHHDHEGSHSSQPSLVEAHPQRSQSRGNSRAQQRSDHPVAETGPSSRVPAMPVFVPA